MTQDVLTFAEAKKLVDSGEWLFEDDIWSRLDTLIQPRLDHILSDERVRAQVLVQDKPVTFGAELPPEMETLLFGEDQGETQPPKMIVPWRVDVLHALREHVERSAEDEKYFVVPQWSSVSNPLSSELRTGRGKIIKLGPTFHKTRWEILAVIGAILAVANWNALAVIAMGASIAGNLNKIVSALSAAFEKLTDPKEFLVFETIAMLQGQWSVVNQAAYEGKQYDQAFGHLAPGLSEIETAIASHPFREEVPQDWRQEAPEKWRQDLVKTMQNMKERGVLKEREGAWSIVF